LYNSVLFLLGNFWLPDILRRPAPVFQGEQIHRVKNILPFVKNFSGYAKVSASMGDILAGPEVIHPFQSISGILRQLRILVIVVNHTIERSQVINYLKT
jgi:hypothetical protein